MCQCKECSNKEMELLPEFEGMFGNEFEMEIDPEFGIPDFISDAAVKVVSPVLDGAQKVISPFFNWVTGNITTERKPIFPTTPTGRGGVGLGPFLNFERLEIRYHISKGNRNENNLTDIIFFNRHPELGHKKLTKSMPAFEKLSTEWLQIRNNLVRPLLKSQIFPEMEFENESPNPVISMVDPKKVSCLTSPYKEAIFKKIGTRDPVAVLEKICNRAVEIINNTIDRLLNAKKGIAEGASIDDFILTNKKLAWSLKNRLLMNVRTRESWLGRGTRNASLIIRWLTNIRNRISSRDLWYTCIESKECNDRTWAWVYYDKNRINLCTRFWIPQPGIDKEMHFEFQAQVIIHEVSHIYYNTEDKGRGPGAAECLRQFIADANNLINDSDFESRCGGKTPEF